MKAYEAAIDAGRLPFERGVELSDDDLIRKAVIMELMANFSIDIARVEKEHNIRFAEYFADALAALEPFKKEELALLLTLPDTEHATQEIEREEINVELGVDSLAYKGKKVDFEELDRILADVKAKEKPVNVRIDKAVTYERVTKLLDLLNKHALNNLALETRHKQ
jgi:biopolymer transport protein ExbD